MFDNSPNLCAAMQVPTGRPGPNVRIDCHQSPASIEKSVSKLGVGAYKPNEFGRKQSLPTFTRGAPFRGVRDRENVS